MPDRRSDSLACPRKKLVTSRLFPTSDECVVRSGRKATKGHPSWEQQGSRGPTRMTSMRRLLAGLLLLGATLPSSAQTLPSSAQWVEPGTDTPAHFSKAPHPAGPPILAGSKLSGPYFTHAFQVTIYKMAALIAPVLYQQPCFCRCDRALRHKSLHSCFEGLHGASCASCMREALYAYQQTHLGKTPAEIRAAIERGDWQNVQLESATL